MFDALSAFTPSGPGCVHSGLSGMSIVGADRLHEQPFEIGVDQVRLLQRVAHAIERRRRIGAARVHLDVADDQHLDGLVAVVAGPLPRGIARRA